jgi:hypothetical protein
MIGPVVSVAAVSLALILVVAATSKAMRSSEFANVLRVSRLPESYVPLVTRAVPAAELALAVTLLLARGAALAVVFGLAAGLLTSFTAWMVRILARGLSVDCGCFGGGSKIGRGTIARNLLLASVAGAGVALVVVFGAEPEWTGSLWTAMVATAALCVAALGTAVHTVYPELALRVSQVLDQQLETPAAR